MDKSKKPAFKMTIASHDALCIEMRTSTGSDVRVYMTRNQFARFILDARELMRQMGADSQADPMDFSGDHAKT